MIGQVRSFNRAVTQRAGALNDTFLSRGRPLGQARLLWEIGPDGVVRQKFHLWHAEDVPVQITGMTLSTFFLPATDGSAPSPPTTVALDHTRLLRHTEIRPAAFVDESLEYDFGSNAAVYAVTFAVQGVADGTQARGELTLLRPPPAPTRENSIPIQDPAMVQKIRRAMTILNQQTVSQEENPLYYDLIRAFHRKTGIPVILNTSFNENEPIVCTPGEAVGQESPLHSAARGTP